MWRIVGTTLINKANLWKSTDAWKLPGLDKFGMIENTSVNKSLKIEQNQNTKTNEVKEEAKDNDDSLQKWNRKKTDRSDYFLLKNPKTGTFLTAASNGQLTVDGNYNTNRSS